MVGADGLVRREYHCDAAPSPASKVLFSTAPAPQLAHSTDPGPLFPCPPCAGSGRTSPAAPLAAANPALVTRRPGSDTGSPLGRYGAVGSPSSQGAASSGIGAAAEEALVARMGGLTTRDLGVPTATSVQVCWMGGFWLAGGGVGSRWACWAAQRCAARQMEGSLQAARVPGPAPPPCSPVLGAHAPPCRWLSRARAPACCPPAGPR